MQKNIPAIEIPISFAILENYKQAIPQTIISFQFKANVDCICNLLVLISKNKNPF